MSAPLVWIIFPGIMAVALLFLRKYSRLNLLLGVGVALSLAGLAWINPIGTELSFGPIKIAVGNTIFVLGRRFELLSSDTPALVLIYLGAAFWFGGAPAAGIKSIFISIGLGVAALLTAVLAVEPFLYAALLIELVVLLCVPILSPPGKPVSQGILRFVIFQSLGMPFILFTSWLLEGIQAGPGASASWLQVGILLGLGFSFLLGVFPFHSWIPMLAETAPPFIAAFVFYILTLVFTFFGLGFLYRYPVLQNAPDLPVLLQIGGILMTVTGGIWAAFQRHLGRMMGFAVMVEIGLTMLSISVALSNPENNTNISLIFSQILPRGLSLGVWALTLQTLKNHSGETVNDSEVFRFRNIQGLGRKLPIATAVLLIAHFSLAGVPLFASFPVRLILWSELNAINPLVASFAYWSSAGLLVGGLRTLSVLVMGPSNDVWSVGEHWYELLFLVIGGVLLLAIGMFPQAFFPIFDHMVEVFSDLMP